MREGRDLHPTPVSPRIDATTNAAVAPRPEHQMRTGAGMEIPTKRTDPNRRKGTPPSTGGAAVRRCYNRQEYTCPFSDHFHEPVCFLVFEPLPGCHPARLWHDIFKMDFRGRHGWNSDLGEWRLQITERLFKGRTAQYSHEGFWKVYHFRWR